MEFKYIAFYKLFSMNYDYICISLQYFQRKKSESNSYEQNS